MSAPRPLRLSIHATTASWQPILLSLHLAWSGYKYVFFMSPLFPGNERRPQFERNGIEVWSVDF